MQNFRFLGQKIKGEGCLTPPVMGRGFKTEGLIQTFCQTESVLRKSL